MYVGNREPPLDELLNDHIAVLLMVRDGLCLEEVWAFVAAAQRMLLDRKEGSSDRPPLILPGTIRAGSIRTRLLRKDMSAGYYEVPEIPTRDIKNDRAHDQADDEPERRRDIFVEDSPLGAMAWS